MKPQVYVRLSFCSRVPTFVTLLLVFLALGATALAQTTTARLEGTVLDQSGAVVPNAKVTVTNVKTQVSEHTASNSEGYFTATALQPGTYGLNVEASGFRRYSLNDIELAVGASVSEIVKLQVGQSTEVVQVEATTAVIQTTESQISRVVTMRDIDTLPQLGRTPITLAVYGPGVSFGGANSQGDPTFSRINGQRQGSNNTTLDGIDVNDAVVPRLGLSLTANNVDSVGEFRIITEGAKAEYGRNAGGQIEMITRSGTNAYHGNGFDFLRNTDLNANDFFNNSVGASRPLLIQNIFGGSFGAPIKHDKLFIFGNYQGRRTHSTISRVRTVPTVTAKQGLFRYNPTNGGPTQTVDLKAIDPLHIGIDPQVAKLLALYPNPNDSTVGDLLNSAGYRFNNPNNSLEDQFTIKADYNLTSNNHIFFRESWQRNTSIDSLNSADAPFPGQVQGTQGGHRWGVSTGWDWVINSSLVNELRYGHQSSLVAFNRPERLPTTMYPFTSGFTDPISTAFPQGRNSPVDEYVDNLTWIHGPHAIKFGGNFRHIDQYGYNYAGVYPNTSFSTANGNAPAASLTPPNISSADTTRFQNIYNDLLGRVSSVSQTFYSDLATFQPGGNPVVRNYLFNDVGFFAQDDFKIRRNLTLNIGLRWEYFGVPHERDGFQGAITTVNSLAPTNPSNKLTIAKSGSWYDRDLNNFAPRFGFSWDPQSNGKMVIRGNYGIFFDRAIGAITSSVDQNTPGFADNEQTTPNLSGADVRASQAVAPGHAAAPLLTPPDTRSNSIIYVFNPKLATGYVHQYSLTIQRQIGFRSVIEGGYVGNRGVKLFMERDINQAQVYSSGFLNAFQELQSFCPSGSTCTGPTPSANNTLVKIFGTPAAAVSGVGGATVLQQGLLGTAANNVDRSPTAYNGGYAKAGVTDFYLRPFPQFLRVVNGLNDGRSYYDSFYLTLRRSAGDLRYQFNYTFSKTLDNISVDSNGFTSPLDNFNLGLNKGRGDADHPHNFNWSAIYSLPWGKGKKFGGSMPHWLDTLSGGWEIGMVGVWQSGNVFSVASGRLTGPYYNNATINNVATTLANYSGDRNIGGVMTQGNGVFYFTPAQIAAFSFPAAGTVGTSGRNAFRGPKYFDTDVSLVKRFKITERFSTTFRAEAYNVFNNVNFQNPTVLMTTTSTFGKISQDFGPGGSNASGRIMQLALRFDF